MIECTSDEWSDHILQYPNAYATQGVREGSDSISSMIHKNEFGEPIAKVRYHDDIHKTFYINKTVTPPVKGLIGKSREMIYFHDDQNVFRVPALSPGVADVRTGYLQGRWECSIEHWNRYCDSVYNLPKVSLTK